MKAKSIKGKTPVEIKSALVESMADGFKPTLALVFLSIKLDIKVIVEIFNEKGISIWGATTFGEISGNKISYGGISVLLMDINPAFFKIYLEEYEMQLPEVASHRIASNALAQFSKPVFIIVSSQFNINYTKLIKGFIDVAGGDIELFGAVAGDEITFTEGYTFTNSKISRFGLAALAFDMEKIDIKSTSICGWNPVGTVKTVTESNEGRIFKIDDEPALDLTLRYAGIKNLSEDFNEAVIQVSRTLAMQFPKEKGEAVTLVGIFNKDDRSIFTHRETPIGTKLQFAVPPDFEIVEEAVERCNKLKQDIQKADAVFLYSCAARLDVIGPLVNDEVEDINKIFDAPLAGFFSNGEIGRANNGDPDIHNCTTFCLALKEK